ncbi:MAG: efflux RND transporter periplasmic adaptor subunit [Candidatus Paceibacteria bacterium]
MKKALIIILILIIIGAVANFVFLRNGLNGVDPDTDTVKEVSLISIKELQEKESPLSIIGEVISENEVTIKTEASGGIIGVYVQVGDFVQKGRIIAEVENSSERAAVLKAQGAVEQAEAVLAKTIQGSRQEQISILELKLKQADELLDEAKQATLNTLRSEFATADDAVRNKVDQFFSNPRSTDPKLSFATVNSQLKIDIEFQRFAIGKTLSEWNEELSSVEADSDLFENLKTAEINLTEIRDFLDDTATAVNSLTPSSNLSQTTIDAWKAAVLTGRTNVNTSLSDISGAKDNLNNKIAAYDIAKKQQEQGFAGGREEDVIAAEAALKQAQGTLSQAQAGLEKTIIRSPISGTINDIDIEEGDFVSTFESAAVVSNSDALEITAFITEDDKRAINVGAEALIEDRFIGVVSEVAPALDKATKKIEIKVAIVNPETGFLEGESVELEVERSFTVDESTKEIIVPISALKVGTDDIFVFSVNEINTLVAHPVSVGSIVGNGIIVFSGIDSQMEIVLDARGLKEGQEVIIK